MKSPRNFKEPSGICFRKLPAAGVGLLLLCLAAASTQAQMNTVRSCTEAALRSAMAGGGTVTFACSGTITLSGTIDIETNTVLDGSGQQVSISGGNSVRVFYVNPNVTLTLVNLTIAHGWSTSGGGVLNAGTLNATNCSFVANSAVGASASPGQGFSGEPGAGGAICNLGSMVVERSLFANNTASGGAGGAGGPIPPGIGLPGIPGGGGGFACGALYVGGPSSLVNCTLTGNQASGGSGAPGGAGGSGYNKWLHQWVYFPGGAGGGGGMACGAVYDATGGLRLTNCTIACNFGVGGAGAYGGSGDPVGAPGGTGVASAIQTANGVLANCVLDGNSPCNATGCIADAGHNLSSDASCGFTRVGSMNNTDPMLGPLQDNGGPTLTMALLPGSPAIDAGDTSLAPPTDQRGFPRPAGSAADIGAYEFSPPVMASPPPSQTSEDGATVDMWAPVSGPALGYEWFFNGSAIVGCTNSDLCMSGVQGSNIGSYTFVVSNADGTIASGPVMLNIIAPVERRSVPAITLTGETGSVLNLDYADSLSAEPNWTNFDSVMLTNNSQFYFDLSSLAPQRFYRAWQTGTPSVVPWLDLHMVPAITLTGNIGDNLRLDYINQFGPTDAWVTLATVKLTNTSQLYFDTSSIGQPPRLWRIVPVP